METKKIRVAVVITTNDRWEAFGCSGWPDAKNMAEAESCIDFEDLEGCNRLWLEAEIPIPEAKELEVVPATVKEE